MIFIKDEFKLLEKSRNIVFICEPRLQTAKENMVCNAISPELTENSELKGKVESVKEAVIKLESTVPVQHPSLQILTISIRLILKAQLIMRSN